MTSKNSMMYWYQKIDTLNIPRPKTHFVLLTQEEKDAYYKGEGIFLDSLADRVKEVILHEFTLPVFLRTDEASAKHQWKISCFLQDIEKLKDHILEITSFTRCCDIFGGLPIEAIVVREYIPMDSKYTAFHEMPVSPERRYFIDNSKVVCHHAYWIKEAITEPSVANWKELSDEMNKETLEEIELLTKHAELVGTVLPDGFWSVDFCKAKDRTWYLIDMAVGEESWHPKNCKFNRTQEIDAYKDAEHVSVKDIVGENLEH